MRIQAAEARAQQSERKRQARCLSQNIVSALNRIDLLFLKIATSGKTIFDSYLN